MIRPNPIKSRFTYALITAARNEEAHIGACIESVLRQSLPPDAWVIVSDGSTDRTEAIVAEYVLRNPFIKLLRKEPNPKQQGFASKVFALNMGLGCIEVSDYAFVGHLDADITLQGDYYSKIIRQFEANSRLGIAGGYIFEGKGGTYKSRSGNSVWSVAGGIQLFRSECYLGIGGLKPMPLGGEDWQAEIHARMNGWEVVAFPGIPAFHHESSAGKRGLIKEALREGAMDYVMGTHPLFEIVKTIRRLKQKPYGLFAAIRLLGFCKPYVTRQPLAVSEDVAGFLRREQLTKLRRFARIGPGGFESEY